MKKNSLRLIIMLILIMIVFLFYNVRALQEDAYRLMELDLINEASKLSSDFDAKMSGEIRVLEIMRDMIKNIPNKDLVAYEENNPFLVGRAMGLDPYIGLVDGRTLDNRNRFDLKDYDPRERIWYQDAIEKNDTTISDIYIGMEYAKPMMTVSTPLYIEDDLIGVMGVDVLVADLLEMMHNRVITPNAYAYILNKDGRIILHSKYSDRVGRNISEVEDLNEIDIDYIELEEGLETVFYDYEGAEIMAVFKELQSVDWIVGVAIDTCYLNKDALLLSKETIVINLLFFMVILLIVKNLYSLEKVVFDTNELLEEKVYELHEAYACIDQINNELKEKSRTDALTNIANRGYYDEVMESSWQKGLADQKEIALILFDVDYFKKYNDSYGHVMGDQVLANISQLVNSLLDEEDFFARVGGEEFAILGYDKTLEDYFMLADSLRKSIEALLIPHVESPHHYVTISAGVNSIVPGSSDTAGQFYHQTDIAMYESKKTGRNKVMSYSKVL